jgi:hypothetical protein
LAINPTKGRIEMAIKFKIVKSKKKAGRQKKVRVKLEDTGSDLILYADGIAVVGLSASGNIVPMFLSKQEGNILRDKGFNLDDTGALETVFVHT